VGENAEGDGESTIEPTDGLKHGLPMYTIELNDHLKTFDCPDCGEESITAWGWISKDGAAHAVYYAGLMKGHEEASVRLTISIGGWGVENADEQHVESRHWLFIEARPTADSYKMMVREPEESFYFDKRLLGRPMSRATALASPELREFFAVADFVAFNDPAVKSYLIGQEISTSGRKGIE
jgi:hypothetical protein